MPDRGLTNCRILVVEDEYMLADDLRIELEDAGAAVIGPVADLGDAIDLIRAGGRIDAAILDANLGGELVFPAADLLVERHVPILFTTGYDVGSIPVRFRATARCQKPVNVKRVTVAIGQVLHG